MQIVQLTMLFDGVQDNFMHMKYAEVLMAMRHRKMGKKLKSKGSLRIVKEKLMNVAAAAHKKSQCIESSKYFNCLTTNFEEM